MNKVYGIFIGLRFTNIYDYFSNSFISYDGNEYYQTPFQLYESLKRNDFYLDSLCKVLIELFAPINHIDELQIYFNFDFSSQSQKLFLQCLQKAGIFKNVIEAKKNCTFITIQDENIDFNDSLNSNILLLHRIDNVKPLINDNLLQHNYGLYDAELKDYYYVIPKNTPIEELIYDKKNNLNYKYFVDVEQINEYYNRFVLTICEDKTEKLYINFEDGKYSGMYRIYFYLKSNSMCIDVFDLIRNEWLTSDDKVEEHSFKVQMNGL